MGKIVTISVPVVSYYIGKNELFVIQSTDYINEAGIPRFILEIKNNLSFEGFHCGVKCTVKPYISCGFCFQTQCSHPLFRFLEHGP